MSHGEASTAATSGKCSNRTDPGWKYCSPVDEKLTSKVKCHFCNKEMNGGITRAKEHLMGKKGKVAPCPSCPKQVRDELWDHFQSKKNFGSSDFAKYTQYVDLGSTDSTSGIGNADEDATVVRGPMDAFMKRGAAASAGKLSKENMRQQNVKESLDKNAVALVHQDIARFWYHAGLSFNAIRLPYFDRMVKSIGEFGKNLPVPSYHDIRVPLLHKEMEHTEALLEKKKKVWTEVGCSIMSDGWSDRKQRSIINFLVNSPSGSVFIRSIDASGIVKTGEKIFEMLDSMVDEIGEENVVQVVTDNGSYYVAAGKLLMAKREHLYWTPCAAHCIDLMLEDIGKIAVIKNTIKRSISLVGYIYSHGFTLNLLRTTTNKKELVRPAITRFATSYLSLQRLQEERENLRKMFTCDEWMQNKLSKEAKGIEATKTVMKTSFWNNVVYILKIMGPLVRVLRMVDGEKKAAMGYIYEAIEKAKEAIKKSFNGIEKKYEDVFKIIDKRWSCQLHRPLHAAGYFLNPSIFYDNRDLNFDSVVTKGLYACINRLATSKAEEDRVLQQLNVYTNAAGDFFGTEAAQRQRKIVHPGAVEL